MTVLQKGVNEMTLCRALVGGEVIAGKVREAKSFFARMKGLLGVKKIGNDEGMLLTPCRQVHTFGMKFDIDVLFLSKTGEIIHMEASMAPDNAGPFIKDCYQVLELKSGEAGKKKIAVGKRVAFDRLTEPMDRSVH